MGDFESFVRKEPSLANRVISYIARVNVFKKYPITGAGYKNTEYHAVNVLYSMRIPLTHESRTKMKYSKYSRMRLNGAIFWDTLSDTGLVGVIFYYLFLILLIRKNIQLIKMLPNGLIKDFVTGVKNSYICIMCFSFYDIRPNFIYFWFLYGLTLTFINYTNDLYRNEIREITCQNQNL